MFRLLFILYSAFSITLASLMVCIGEFAVAGFLASAAVGASRLANGSFQMEFKEFMDMMSPNYKRVEK